MFGSLFRQAQATVDNAIGQAINRIIIAVPFIVALGFATAALSSWLSRTYGSESSNLILAAGYTVLGLVVALFISANSNAMNAVENDSVAADTKAAEAEASAATAPLGLAEADRELLMTALTTAAPFALPLAIRGLLRNLPLVLVFAVAVFIALRYADGEPTDAQPDAAAAAAE